MKALARATLLPVIVSFIGCGASNAEVEALRTDLADLREEVRLLRVMEGLEPPSDADIERTIKELPPAEQAEMREKLAIQQFVDSLGPGQLEAHMERTFWADPMDAAWCAKADALVRIEAVKATAQGFQVVSMTCRARAVRLELSHAPDKNADTFMRAFFEPTENQTNMLFARTHKGMSQRFPDGSVHVLVYAERDRANLVVPYQQSRHALP